MSNITMFGVQRLASCAIICPLTSELARGRKKGRATSDQFQGLRQPICLQT